MKRALVLCIAFISLPIFSQEKENIQQQLDHWHQAAAEANFDDYFGLMTENSVFIGTDASENWNFNEFKEFSKPYFDKGQAWDFTPLERTIYVAKDHQFAWFHELLDTQMGICRGSGVMKKVNNQWKVQHYVLSITIPNEKVSEIRLINKEHDKPLIEKLKQKK